VTTTMESGVFDYLIPNYARSPMEPQRGEGVWLWDAGGNRYLDFTAGVAVCTLGHASPVMAEVLAKQSRKLVHCSNLYSIREQAELARFLTEEVVQAPGKCFFANSGAEANEALLKLARRYGNAMPAADGRPRYEVVTFSRSFHGRTLATIAATEQEKVRHGFAPLMPGFRYSPFNDVDALRASIRPETVGLLIEPVQGEGGINVAEPGFLRAAAGICAERDLLLLFDEIQCGLGRVGHACGWKAVCGAGAEGIAPHAVSWAKGLGGGFPIGGIWATDRPAGASGVKISELLGPGTHGSTYGGSPLAASVALAVQRTVLAENLAENASTLGRHVRETVAGWASRVIPAMRGLGLMIGFEIVPPAESAIGSAPSLWMRDLLMAERLLTVPAGPDILRWLPPLNVTRNEIDLALGILHGVVQRVAAGA